MEGNSIRRVWLHPILDQSCSAKRAAGRRRATPPPPNAERPLWVFKRTSTLNTSIIRRELFSKITAPLVRRVFHSSFDGTKVSHAECHSAAIRFVPWNESICIAAASPWQRLGGIAPPQAYAIEIHHCAYTSTNCNVLTFLPNVYKCVSNILTTDISLHFLIYTQLHVHWEYCDGNSTYATQLSASSTTTPSLLRSNRRRAAFISPLWCGVVPGASH